MRFSRPTPCDVLLTAHPEVADLWDKLEKRKSGVTPDPMVDPGACRQLARKTLRKQLEALRIARENAKVIRIRPADPVRKVQHFAPATAVSV